MSTKNSNVPACVFAAAIVLSALICAHLMSAQQIKCINTWGASSAAQETWTASNWTEAVSFAVPQKSATAILTDSTELEATMGNSTTITMDISVVGNTSAGSGAGVAIFNIRLLMNWLESHGYDSLWTNLMTDCSSSQSGPCQNDLQQIQKVLSTDDLKTIATWYDGCWHASDSQTKTISNLKEPLGYALGAFTEGGSSASLAATITYSANPGVPHTETIYGPPQGGTMLAPGQYADRFVGHVVPVTAQHGGTVSMTAFSIFAPMAKGKFTIDSTGDVHFTGSVSPSNCPNPQLPKHTIPKLMSPDGRP